MFSLICKILHLQKFVHEMGRNGSKVEGTNDREMGREEGGRGKRNE